MKKLYTSILAASAALLLSPVANADLYLVGEPQGWDIDYSSMEFSESEKGVYEGTFDIPAGKFMFRFYTELGDWETNSIGSQEIDDPIEIALTDDTWYTGKCVDGKGSWNYPYWQGGTLYITVNLNTMNVVFTTDPSVDVPTPASDMFIRGANINGQSAWDGSPAMTYDYTDKVYVWTGTQLGSGFKFSDDLSWNGQYNIGSNGNAIEVGVPYSYYNGGDSGNINFSSNSFVVNNPKVVLDLNAGTVLITGQEEQKEVSLTIAGTFNDWNGNDANYQLKKAENGNYEGTFYMPMEAQFQVVLLGGTWYGCQEGKNDVVLNGTSPVTVALSTGYQNDFQLSGWNGGEITFSVATVNDTPSTLTLTAGTSGISTLESENAPEVIYNLQGVKVSKDNLGKGLYIINGKKVIR